MALPVAKPQVLILVAGSALIALLAFFFWPGRAPTEPSVTTPSSSSTSAIVSSAPAAAVLAASTGLPMPVAPSLSPETRGQLKILGEILASRNDNDPRLDRELLKLSPEAREALVAQYRGLTPEDRNGRGTIVFLIGRNLETARDFEFFREVVTEAPCLSLESCARETPHQGGEDSHHDSGMEVTLAYPQINALLAAEKLLAGDSGASADRRARALEFIRAAKSSPIPRIAQKATEIELQSAGG